MKDRALFETLATLTRSRTTARDVLLLPNWAIIHETKLTWLRYLRLVHSDYCSTRNTAKTIYHRSQAEISAARIIDFTFILHLCRL